MSIGIWILLGVLVVCCVLPMLMKRRRDKTGSGGKGKEEGPQSP